MKGDAKKDEGRIGAKRKEEEIEGIDRKRRRIVRKGICR
jgi:hypothetical protein